MTTHRRSRSLLFVVPMVLGLLGLLEHLRRTWFGRRFSRN